MDEMTGIEVNAAVKHETWGHGVICVIHRSNGEITKVRVGFGDTLRYCSPDGLEVLG